MFSLGGGGGGGGGGEELATSTDTEGTSTTLLGFPFLLASACDLSSDNVSCGAATDTEETLPTADLAFLLADACAFNSTNDNFATDGCGGGGFGDATDTASEIGERANKFDFFFLPDCVDSSANVGFGLY